MRSKRGRAAERSKKRVMRPDINSGRTRTRREAWFGVKTMP
jgi:hypothetical protein